MSSMNSGISLVFPTVVQLPSQKRRKISGDRFAPQCSGVGAIVHQAAASPYQETLLRTLTSSSHPSREATLLFSSQSKTRTFSVRSEQVVQKPKTEIALTMMRAFDVAGLADDFYQQAMVYNSASDCLGVILEGGEENEENRGVYVQKGSITRKLPIFFEDPMNRPTAIEFTPKGNTILCSSARGLTAYDLRFSQQAIQCRRSWSMDSLGSSLENSAQALAVTHSWIFIGLPDGRIARIDPINRERIEYYDQLIPHRITKLLPSPDGESLLVARDNGTIYLFDVNEPKSFCEFQAFQPGWIKAIAFSPSGNYFAASGGIKDPRMILCEIDKGKVVQLVSRDIGSQATSMFWRGQYILSTHADGKVRTCIASPGNRLSLLSEIQEHLVSAGGHRLTFAAMAPNAFFVACPEEGVLKKLEITSSGEHQPNKKPRSEFTNRYATVR